MIIRGPFAVGLLLLLFVSLAANFLVAGFVIARSNSGPAASADVDRVVAQAVRGFPPEIQRAIADSSRADKPVLRARLEAVSRTRQAMFDAMRAQPFNRAALDMAFADYRTSTVALQKAGQDLVARAIANAPPDVRRRIKPPGMGMTGMGMPGGPGGPGPQGPSAPRLPAT